MKKLTFIFSILLFTGIASAQGPSKPTIDEGTAALKTLLRSNKIQNHFPVNNTIFILNTGQTCFQIYCQDFELKSGGQKVFIGSKEELFMREVKKWLEIKNVYYDHNNQAVIDYHIN